MTEFNSSLQNQYALFEHFTFGNVETLVDLSLSRRSLGRIFSINFYKLEPFTAKYKIMETMNNAHKGTKFPN
ncbi:hypothetical protein BGS_0176 [Beggiatoa sp. SS]|nr:hypothetical protein BGS_0176 [Beggiatoa sp. SS]